MQILRNFHSERMRATEHAPRCPLRVLKRRHGFAEIVERGAVVFAECPRVTQTQPERVFIIVSVNAPRHEQRFVRHRLGFFEAL